MGKTEGSACGIWGIVSVAPVKKRLKRTCLKISFSIHRFTTKLSHHNMNRKFRFALLAASIIFTTALSAQTYRTAAGIRVGEGLDLTFQQYLTNHWTAEGIIHTHLFSKNLGATLLAEKHHKVLTRNLNFYYGIGGHYYARTDENRSETMAIAKNVFGLSAIVGAELSLGRLNLAVDFKPEAHLSGDQVHPLEWNPVSVSARYIIEKRERRKVKDWDVWDRFPKRKH